MHDAHTVQYEVNKLRKSLKNLEFSMIAQAGQRIYLQRCCTSWVCGARQHISTEQEEDAPSFLIITHHITNTVTGVVS